MKNKVIRVCGILIDLKYVYQKEVSNKSIYNKTSFVLIIEYLF